jgi:hypothetical protein
MLITFHRSLQGACKSRCRSEGANAREIVREMAAADEIPARFLSSIQ